MKLDLQRVLKTFLFAMLSSVVLSLFVRDLERTPADWSVLLLSLALSVGLLWLILNALWNLTHLLRHGLSGVYHAVNDPRATTLLLGGLVLALLGLGLGQLALELVGLLLTLAGFALYWPRLHKLRQKQVSVWRWTRRLRPVAKLELTPYAYAPHAQTHRASAAGQTLAPRLELSLYEGQVWLENRDSGSMLVKGLGSAEFNGWWLPRSRGERKPMLGTFEKVEADLWVPDYESVRVKVWYCRLENPLEEFVLEQELGFEVAVSTRVLN